MSEYTYIDLRNAKPDDILHITLPGSVASMPYGITVKNLKKLLDNIGWIE